MRKRSLFLSLFILTIGAIFALPALFLTGVWMRDGATSFALAPAGTNDASHLNANQPREVITISSDSVEAERQLSVLVQRATEENLHISISGAHHSMGGHTIYPGGIVLDMLPFNHLSLDEKQRILTVGSGARWSEVIPYLDQHGFAVSVMQTNNDFSVGGSLSVNCHGWQNDSQPICSTVESFRILTASGVVQQCSRTENKELFSLVLGGYGLFGVMLDVKLHVVPNEYYVAEAHRVNPANYDVLYHELSRNRPDIGMAYGRISVSPSSFLEEGIITLLKRVPSDRPIADTLTHEKPSLLKRLVFRGGVGSSYGKRLRWWLEKTVGETGGKLLSRNQIMNEPADLYATRDSGSTDILQEYFIPAAQIGSFIEKARPVLLRYRPELLNITVRNVERDQDSFMSYAHEEVFGLVMLFHQGRDPASESAMQALTRELIDVALSCGGRYYLPYRPHATEEQFLKAYPQAREFFALKQRHDPTGIFENKFFLNYGRSLTAP